MKNIYLSPIICKKYCTEQKPKVMLKKEYHPIYNLPLIRALSVLSRLKIYHGMATAVGIPSTIVLSLLDIVSGECVLITSSLGVSGMVALLPISYLTNNFIGLVYLHENGKQVKISYLDFWGRRKDEIVEKEDIVPLSDLPVKFTDVIYSDFTRYSNIKKLKINMKYGRVLDEDKFNDVFKP